MNKGSKNQSANEELDQSADVTDLTVGDAGSIDSVTFDDLRASAGFTQVQKIKVGDPESGGIPGYCGQLLMAGNPVQTSLPDGKGGLIQGELPTWICHPAVLSKSTDGTIQFNVQKSITHIIIVPHQLNQDFGQLYTKVFDFETGKLKATGLFAARWAGKRNIKGGARQLNFFDWMERIDPLTSDSDQSDAAAQAAAAQTNQAA